jgi:hypothetical protein
VLGYTSKCMETVPAKMLAVNYLAQVNHHLQTGQLELKPEQEPNLNLGRRHANPPLWPLSQILVTCKSDAIFLRNMSLMDCHVVLLDKLCKWCNNFLRNNINGLIAVCLPDRTCIMETWSRRNCYAEEIISMDW